MEKTCGLLIVHFSDFHFGYKNVCSEKINSISAIINESKCNTVLFVLSGDIANSGKEDEYKVAKIFLDSVSKSIIKSISQYFAICPGNHDCFYKDVKKYSEKEILCINEENYKENLNNRIGMFKNYNDFISNYGKNSKKCNDLLNVISFKTENNTFSVFTLNNVVFYSYNDQENTPLYDNKNCGNIFIPQSYFEPIKNCRSDFIFVVMHAPFWYLNDETRASFKKIIKNKVNIVFSGHLHNEENYNENEFGNEVLYLTFSAFDENKKNGCNISTINSNEGKRTIYKFDGNIFNAIKEEKYNLVKNNFNSLGISLTEDFFDKISYFVFSEEKIELENIFVFPQLSKEPFKNEYSLNNIGIDDFSGFDELSKHNEIIIVYGGDSYGKSSLCYFLFKKYFNLGFFPVILSGFDLNTSTVVEKRIKAALFDEYNDDSLKSIYDQTSLDKKIIFVDDGDLLSKEVELKLLEYCKYVVIFCKQQNIYKEFQDDKIDGHSVLPLYIEPLFSSKRKELLENIFDYKTSLGNFVPACNKNQFISLVEVLLSRIDKIDSIDPGTICFFALETLKGVPNYDSSSFKSAFEARQTILLLKEIEHYKVNYNYKVIKRIIARIAYLLYEKQQTTFDNNILKECISAETNEYGDSNIKISTLVSILIDSKIIRKNENEDFLFYSREVFAYFIAYECVQKNGKSNRDSSLIMKIFSSDIFKPINFLIIMSISSELKSECIPEAIVDSLYKDCSIQKIKTEKEILSFAISSGEIRKLESLTDNDIKKIDKENSKNEKNERINYLKHKDDYFYFDKISDDLKKVFTWINRMRIVNVLLDSFSSDLEKDYKGKLIYCAIKLPNIVISTYYDTLFKELDDIYASISKNHPKSITKDVIKKLQTVFVELKSAFILSTYSLGSQGFTDNAIINALKQYLDDEYKNKSDIVIIQELMLLSYSRQTDNFIKQIKPFLVSKNKSSPFIRKSAFLIARNYCYRNLEDVKKNHRDLFELIVSNKKNAIPLLTKKIN